MHSALSHLIEMIGTYEGHGINHEGQSFTGRLELQPLLTGRGIHLKFSAKGKDGTLYHQEESMIAPSIDEKLTLWNFNTNTPGLIPHTFRKTEPKLNAVASFIFGCGKPEDRSSFREEVTLDIWDKTSVSYTYSWGLPGGVFQERSGVQMKQISARKLDYVMVMVENMDRSIEFYRDLIGLPVRFSSESWTELNAGLTTLALHSGGRQRPCTDSEEPHGNLAGTASIGFNVDNLEVIFEHLKAKGVTFTLAPTPRQNEGILLAVAVDPDGLEISFTQLLKGD